MFHKLLDDIVRLKLGLISTHTFRLLPEKFFALDKKYLWLCSHVKFKYFKFCKIFLPRNQSDFFLTSLGADTAIDKFVRNGRPAA